MGIGKLTRKSNPFSNVVASGTATNQITPGRTIANMQLKLGGTSLTKARSWKSPAPRPTS